MAERVVSVRLQARVEGFTAGMRKAKASVDDLTKADIPKASRAYGELANKAALAGAAIAVGLGAAIKRFADFDAAMSAVAANSGAAGAELESLRAAAIKLGADSQFSATEAAQGVNELAKAGVESAAILGGGLKGSLDLAAAGQIGVAQAAETTASALTQFNLTGADAVHVADLLTNGANKAQGGVGDLGAALNQVGLVASATGLSIEETTAGLSAFASAGLIGSDAGTSFKTMLQRLSAPSGEAAQAMKDLGISAYDSQGQFVGLASVAGQLQTSLGDLTPAQRNAALATIFGADAIRAANVLYTEGEQGIRKWTDAVSVQGAAAKQAATLTDNLRGDLERLGGAFDSVLIQSGSGANDALRTLTQGLQSVVETVGKVPGPVLLAGAGLASLALVVPKGVSMFKSYTANLDAMGLSMEKIAARGPRAARGVDLVGRAAKAGAVAAATAAIAFQAFGEDVEGIGTQTLTGDLLDADNALAALNARFAENASLRGLDSGIRSFGDALKSAFDPSAMEQVDSALGTIKGFFGGTDVSNIAIAEQRFRELDGALAGMVSSGNVDGARAAFVQLAEAAKAQGIPIDQLTTKLPGYTDALAGVNNAARDSAGGTGVLDQATQDAEQSAQDAADAWDRLRSAIEGLGSPLAQQRAASRDFEAAIDAASEAVKENGRTLDEGTSKGRANAAALDEIRQATLDKVLADYQLTGSTEDATRTMQEGRDAFIDAAREAGLTKDEAKALADQLGLIPDNVKIIVSQSGAAETSAAIDKAARDRFATVWVDRRYRNTDFSSEFQGVGGRATGGAITGPGSGTSDTAGLFRLSNGEHVWTAAEVAKLGGQSAMYALRAAVRQGQFPGLAHGGAVAPQFAPRVQVVTVPGSGGPQMTRQDYDQRINIERMYATDVDSFRRNAERRRNAAYSANVRAS